MAERRTFCYVAAGAVICAAAAFGQQAGNVLMVDDDGVQCPGALTTIQEAVSKAGQGATILVCPGTYRRQVTIKGIEKTGLKLIALGHDDEVVLEGDHTEPYGFLLDDVTNVLIRGFTIREWGNKPTTANQYGNGCGIHLQKAHFNTIEHNRISKADMTGIYLDNSGHNTVRYNLITEIDPKGNGWGIALSGGRGTEGNFVFANRVALSPGGGIWIWTAGTGNLIVDNNLNNNGGWGIGNWSTDGTVIEGNRASHNPGSWGVSPDMGDGLSRGIGVFTSDKVLVVGNMAHNNTRFDIAWDGLGNVTFENNSCNTWRTAGVCNR